MEIQYDEPALDSVDKIKVDSEEFEVSSAVKTEVVNNPASYRCK